MKNIVLILLLVSLNSYSQDWKKYSDSTYSNILKAKNEKAKEFLFLAEKELEKEIIVKDTTYADFLYRKGLVLYYQEKSALSEFEESLKLWENSGYFNAVKVMKIVFFIAESYYSGEKYDLAYKNYEKCYQINKIYKVPLNSNYVVSLYALAENNYDNKNYDNARKYALEYINLTNDQALKAFDLSLVDAFHFARDDAGVEKTLFLLLTNYEKEKLNAPVLLFDIYDRLSKLYYKMEEISGLIVYGEKAIEIYNKSNFDEGSFLIGLYERLSWGYRQIGNNIKEKEYNDLYYKLNQNGGIEDNYYDQLMRLSDLGDFDLFKEKFDEYESIIISQKDNNTLLRIYYIAYTLFESSILFNQEDIERQINYIEKNKENLDEENKEYFEVVKARFSFFTGDYLKALQISNTLIDSKNKELRLVAYRQKTQSEVFLGIPEGVNTSYEALIVATEIYGNDSPQILPFLDLVLSADINQTDKKIYKIISKALEIISKNGLEKTSIASELYSSIGTVYRVNYNYYDSILYFRKAIEINQINKTDNENALNQNFLGLAATYIALLDFESALEFLDKYKLFLESNPNFMKVGYGDYYFMLGRYYFNQGNWELAKNAYEKCFEFYGNKLSKGRDFEYLICDYFLHYDVKKTILELENYYNLNGDVYGVVLKFLYLLKYNIGLVDDARELLIKNIKGVIETNNLYFHLLSDTERELVYSMFNDQFELINSHLLFNNDISFINQFIDFRFYYKSLLFNNSSNKFNVNSVLSSYNELKNNKVLLNKYYESEKDNLNDIETLLSRNRELEKFLAQNRKPLNILNLQDLTNHLGNNEAYIEIIRINKHSKSEVESNDKLNLLNMFTDSIYYGAIIIKKEIEPKFVIIDEKNLLETRYLNYHQNHITGSNKSLTDNRSYSLFFETIDKELDGIERIYLSTDGIYNSINVESLYNSEKDKYILDYLDVNQVLSIRSILNDAEYDSNMSELSAVIIGNPEFALNISSNQNDIEAVQRDFNIEYFRENSNSKDISYLPGTEKEINSINDILTQNQWDVQLFSKATASEENLKNINSPDILHIATHGYFLDAPIIDNSKISFLGVETNHIQSNIYLRSGLLFSGAQNTVDGDVIYEKDNGFFTAQEAKNLNLKDTDVVVLSACETGLGENQSGEGVYGLQRAFMIAGAKSIIMSLWKVNDETTQKLMTLFYTNWIGKKMPKREAFKLAKLDLKKEHPEPFYWAPFILIE